LSSKRLATAKPNLKDINRTLSKGAVESSSKQNLDLVEHEIVSCGGGFVSLLPQAKPYLRKPRFSSGTYSHGIPAVSPRPASTNLQKYKNNPSLVYMEKIANLKDMHEIV